MLAAGYRAAGASRCEGGCRKTLVPMPTLGAWRPPSLFWYRVVILSGKVNHELLVNVYEKKIVFPGRPLAGETQEGCLPSLRGR